jgi:hypothetical protein
MRTKPVRYAATAALLLALAGCSGGEDGKPDATPTTETGSPAPTPSTPPGEMVTVEPVTNLLEWQPVESDTQGTSVASTTWVATIVDHGRRAEISSDPGQERGSGYNIPAARGRRITDVFLADELAVVVQQDRLEERPQDVTVLDLTGSTHGYGVTDPQPAAGGPLALHGDRLHYATLEGGRYCLATYDIREQSGEVIWCAPKRHGFSNVAASPAGTALMTFDDKRPVSCRALVTVADDGALTPLDGPPSGPPECKGWDVLATTDGSVWSTLSNERQIERGDFFARADGQTFALGTGVTGSLTWCGNSAYFTRDAQKGGHAQLLRWTPEHTLEIAYRSPGRGEAFLEAPRCADPVLTISAYGEGGDEQVSATVPR